MRISAIIPPLAEQDALPHCLADLARERGPVEVIVADGGSRDRTVEIARAASGVTVLQVPRGRAVQMNRAADHASGEVLWFLHADSRVPPGAADAIRGALAEGDAVLGAFRFAVDSPRLAYRAIEALVRLRCALFALPYGDQGLFIRRDTFTQHGGYDEVPILEDLLLVRALKRRGRVTMLPMALSTSPRRWERGGLLRVTLRNQALLVLDRLGVSSFRLAESRLARLGTK